MEDLRVKEEQKKRKSSKFKLKVFLFWRRRKWWIVSIIILAILISFPQESGEIIGQWIHDFIGNLVKYSKF